MVLKKIADAVDDFFGDDISFWQGKIVNVDKNPSQRTLMSGGSWGFRYRVRLIADYSTNDTVNDDDVYTAQALLPLTAGTGAAGRSESLKISQGDMVLGIFLGPNRTAPFIISAFPRTSLVKQDGKGKYAVESGFTRKVKPGLQELQEFAETSLPKIPLLFAKLNKGNGKGKGTPVDQLKNLAGGLSDMPVVGAFGKLSGNLSTAEQVDADLDAEIERARAGDRSGLDEALDIF
tara:strand:- start:7 stop:708 length:702 start_codon:yes stop_codon:yes gene_type:complete